MFGRRSRRATPNNPEPVSDGTDAIGEPSNDTIATPAPEISGLADDSGLGAVEAEFTISDADLRLLDVASLGLDDLPSPLTAAESAMAEHRQLLDEFMVQLNAAWSARLGSPTSLRPFFLVPERCWEGQHCDALVEILGLAPAQPWNIIPLPCDSRTASALGLPLHPGNATTQVDVARPIIDDAIHKMRARFEQASFAGDTVDTAALESARVQAATEIRGLASKLGTGVLGADALTTARAAFFGDDRAEKALRAEASEQAGR